MIKQKDKPILFSTEMVKAILEGRKTQTRRVVKPQPPEDWDNLHIFCDANYFPTVIDKNGEEQPGEQCFGSYDEEGIAGMKCPFGQPGDILWVRETYAAVLDNVNKPKKYLYKADLTKDEKIIEELCKWKPSIFMPKEACRIKLRIGNVRVERLDEVSEADAFKEGVEKKNEVHYKDYLDSRISFYSARDSFFTLWESINGKGSLEQNPWVWVIEFERVA